jgi:hypothetical protein
MYDVIDSPWSLRSDAQGMWERINGNGSGFPSHGFLPSASQMEFDEKLPDISLDEVEELKRAYASLIIQLDRLRPKLAAADALALRAESGCSVKEILGKLIDTDREIWWPRITAILERKKWHLLPMEDVFAQVMRTRWEFAMKLQEIAASDFEKTGEHPTLGEVSILRILQILVANDARYIENINSMIEGRSEMAYASL